MVDFRMANLKFLRVPGQDLAENGPFAFKPIMNSSKKYAFILENLARSSKELKKVVWLQWIGYLGRVGCNLPT